jgi:hypothetical protein
VAEPSKKPWYLTSTEIEAKGKEIGLSPDPASPFVYFRNQVYQHFGVTGEMVRKAKIDWNVK